MSLKTHHITSHSKGCPSHARIPSQNFSNFEPIYMIPCASSFQIALIFWHFKVRDLLKVWHSQCQVPGVPGVSLDSQTGWWRALLGSHDAWWAFPFLIILYWSNLVYLCIFFSFSLHSTVICFLSWVTLQLSLESFGVAVCSSLPWGRETWRETVERDCQPAVYKATHPVYSIATHHEPRRDQLHNSKSS